jgi:hypothetical protein
MNQEIKDVVVEGCKLAVAINKAIVDGEAKLGVIKIAADFLPVLVALPAALGGIDKVPEELKSLTPEEKQDLVDAAKAELHNLPEENVVPIVDSVLDAIVAFWKLV